MFTTSKTDRQLLRQKDRQTISIIADLYYSNIAVSETLTRCIHLMLDPLYLCIKEKGCHITPVFVFITEIL